MNAREHFLAVMNFEPVRTLKWEFGYWAGTLRRWYGEGLPRERGVPDDLEDGRAIPGGTGGETPERAGAGEVQSVLGMDEGMRRVFVNNYFCPEFPEEVLEDHGDWHLLRDKWGVIVRRSKRLASLTKIERGPVASREDWERLKAERLQPRLAERLPSNWPELKEEYRTRTFPLQLGGGQGFFGTARYLFGEIQVLTAFYDCPDLMQLIMNDLADFWIALYDQVLDQVDVDMALIWEDMCYKAGPLISPTMFREFMLPAYRKLTSFFNDRGVHHINVDCDGNIWKLIPLWIEGGVTCIHPFEVNAGMDVVQVRKAFPHLQMQGGLDKVALQQGRASIDAELEAKVPYLLNQRGYIPHVDHHVPPDISWEHFCYYRNRLNGMIDAD